MVTCSRRKVKSTLPQRGRGGGDFGLTAAGPGATVAAAVVTTFSFAGTSRLWPTALSLLVDGVLRSAAEGAIADIELSADDSHEKCWPSKARLLFQTAKARCSNLRMQWPMATSPRVPLALRRR